MRIYFYDGTYADCVVIEFEGRQIVWDGCRVADISEVERIES